MTGDVENNGTITQLTVDLVTKHIPIVFFHSHESYFPSSIEYFLANCQDSDAHFRIENSSPQLASAVQNSFLVEDAKCQYGFHESKDLDITPLYISCVDISPQSHRISYYLFFPHRPECCPCFWGNFAADEIIDSALNKTLDRRLSPITELFEIQVTTSGLVTHAWINSKPVHTDELEWYNGRIVLYSKKGIHTLANRPPHQLCGDYYTIPFVARNIEIVNKKFQ